ncbi:hypothetical protein PsYK624_056060 [Phanerochaete sordida]|uniref:Uncharacterized protein n=1 Tax=Phanerochaete sordida TaxID=48140 RepID=A0A9P3G8P9_9APHY|nr:hypothetical protein PsYK624_056060 [Phanerochaete sordida]
MSLSWNVTAAQSMDDETSPSDQVMILRMSSMRMASTWSRSFSARLLVRLCRSYRRQSIFPAINLLTYFPSDFSSRSTCPGPWTSSCPREDTSG